MSEIQNPPIASDVLSCVSLELHPAESSQKFEVIYDNIIKTKARIVVFKSFQGHKEKIENIFKMWQEKTGISSQKIISIFCNEILEDGKKFLTDNNTLGLFTSLKKSFEKKLEEYLKDNKKQEASVDLFFTLSQDLLARVIYEYLRDKKEDVSWRLVTEVNKQEKQVSLQGHQKTISFDEAFSMENVVFICPQYLVNDFLN